MAGAATLVLLLGIYTLWNYEKPYTPPPFESNAAEGVPKPEDSFGYGTIEHENSFAFAAAGSIYQQEDGSVILYFTNPEESQSLMMCEIVEKENGNTLYRTGLLKPGEYVERVKPLEKIPNEAIDVEMKVYAFEEATFYSKGAVTLGNTLQAW